MVPISVGKDYSPPSPWRNVCGQVLEIGAYDEPIHRRQLLPKAYLTENQYANRGFFIQRYIDLGWIAVPLGAWIDFFLSSLVSETSLMMLSLEASFGTVSDPPGQHNYDYTLTGPPQAGLFQGTFTYQGNTGSLLFPYPSSALVGALGPLPRGTYKLSGGTDITVNGTLTI